MSKTGRRERAHTHPVKKWKESEYAYNIDTYTHLPQKNARRVHMHTRGAHTNKFSQKTHTHTHTISKNGRRVYIQLDIYTHTYTCVKKMEEECTHTCTP